MKKFDFHVHSTCSKHGIWGIDGVNSPQEMVERAVHIGLDGIAITDHNTLKGSQKAIKYVHENNLQLLIIPGAEIRSKDGDILALGINENIKQKLPVLETIDAIKSQDGIVIAAHPYKYNTFIAQKLADPLIRSRFDAIEVFNAGVPTPCNLKAKSLVEKFQLPGIAVSDAHHKLNLGKGLTYLEVENLAVDEVLSAIQKNKIKIECNYPPLRNVVRLYSKKILNLFKRSIGKGIKTC